jgi:hypothetical protein
MHFSNLTNIKVSWGCFLKTLTAKPSPKRFSWFGKNLK